MIFCKKLNSIILTSCLFALLMSSCGAPKQKTDEAFEQVKKERMMSPDSNVVSDIIIQEPKGTDFLNRKEKPDEWTTFKNKIERKIQLNENKIRKIKLSGISNNGLLRNVDALEKINKDLRLKMDEYHEEEKVKWETFKTSMDHRVNEIEIELNAINTDLKK